MHSILVCRVAARTLDCGQPLPCSLPDMCIARMLRHVAVALDPNVLRWLSVYAYEGYFYHDRADACVIIATTEQASHTSYAGTDGSYILILVIITCV